jgi:hypothetical protein
MQREISYSGEKIILEANETEVRWQACSQSGIVSNVSHGDAFRSTSIAVSSAMSVIDKDARYGNATATE